MSAEPDIHTLDERSLERRQRFLDGMSVAACTVSVVTTNGPAGRFGVTVSAMSSVSADGVRPTLLVCVHHKSPAAEAIIENGVFCLNFLRDGQSMISDSFAGRAVPPGGDKFAVASWSEGATGAPRLTGGLVAFDCRLQSQQQIGTHHVFIGEVEEIMSAADGSPLIYANRAYGTHARLPVRAAGSPETLSLGVFHTFAPYLVPEIVSRLSDAGRTVDLQLLTGDQEAVIGALKGGASDLALLYDFDLPSEYEVERLAALPPYVLLAENHPLAAKQTLSLAELATHPMVLLDAPPSGAYFRSLFEAAGLRPNIRYRVMSFETVRGFVGHGLGYSLLATKPASNMSYDGRALTTRPLAEDAACSQLAMVVGAPADPSPVFRAAVEAVRSIFRQR
ncbi:LysR substrate-binding domain-containing protein [Consotaella aegiceratis]|uniref:LysR substrate-binding domain-containing protein n=1 Tax=Consotaella aegiceratis TaxID=3097961 RepID=UPI002F3E68A9